MHRQHGTLLVLLALVAMIAATPASAREVADEDVDRVIDETINYLYGQQSRAGNWPHHHHMRHHEMPQGGTTAIALFALLEAGESHQSEDMIRGLNWLSEFKTNNLYVRAVRTMVLSQVVARSEESPYRQTLAGDVEWLTKSAVREGGAWGYTGPERYGDNSCSQFALLALWEAERAGVDVPAAVVRSAESTWVRRQRPDGGWTYAGQRTVNTPSTTSMTTAGLASLYITQDVLSLVSGPYRHQRHVDEAWEYLAQHLTPKYIEDGYLAFCVQRVGMASGQKFVGDMDWFATGAGVIAKPDPRGRRYRGPYGNIVRAAFELIFMSRGRIPLTFNKLEYGEQTQWNFHSRDVPRFTEYMRREFELRMRWQVVDVADDIQLLLDAPILLVEGTADPGFTPTQWARLREYTLRGGTLLFVPTNNSERFAEAIRENLTDLYAAQRQEAGKYYSLDPLGDDHPVYSAKSPIPDGSKLVPIEGVSDGTREMAMLLGRDICASWQRMQPLRGRLDFQMGTNLYFYATGANPMRMRMRPVFVGTSTEARHTAKVAWVRHDGNWNTQPYALNYLSQKLVAENRVKIDLSEGAPLEADGLAGHHLAWMTGTDAFELSDPEIEALRGYIDSGGTLFVNAIGGAREFNGSARDMLRDLFPTLGVAPSRRVVSGYVTSDSPLMTGKAGEFRGPPLEALRRTQPWILIQPDASPPLRVYVRGNRVVAIYAPNGVHDTLDGHTGYGALSYLPGSARNIAANVVLYGLMDKPKPPAPPTQPTEPAATAPAETRPAATGSAAP